MSGANLLRRLLGGGGGTHKSPLAAPETQAARAPRGGTYIKEERVVHGEWQLDVAQVARAVAEVLHTGGAHLFGICRAQS